MITFARDGRKVSPEEAWFENWSECVDTSLAVLQRIKANMARAKTLRASGMGFNEPALKQLTTSVVDDLGSIESLIKSTRDK